jgi:hypothetical protein
MNWTDADKQIFEYVSQDGEKRFADPLAVRRAILQASGGQIDAWWKEITVPETIDGRPNPNFQPLAVIANEAKVIFAARKAFDLADFDTKTGAGVTDAYALVLTDHYLNWLGQKKTDMPTKPTSSIPTVGIPNQETSHTSSSSDSSPTPHDCGCAKLT